MLSSAAFSLGHGGADSQKVMGIICAALMVYANLGRENKLDAEIPKMLQIAEIMQIEYRNADDKIEKYKPEIGSLNGINYFADNDKIIDTKTKEVIFNEEKVNEKYSRINKVSSFNEFDDELSKLRIYSKGKNLLDDETNEVIFFDKKINKTYSKASIFGNYIKDNKLKSGHSIKTKVDSDKMPFWIAFGCYLMIGLGTLMGGWKIVKTMGTKITKVTPLEGVCAETAGALTLFTVSQLGIPVSTTHTITGSIIGVGATKRLSAVRWGVTISLLWAWILTIPVSAGLAGLIYYLIVWFK